MKKVFNLLFCFFVFFLVQNDVQAKQAYIYLGDPIPGIRLHLKTPTVEKDKLMYEIINRNTGEYVYCIEPGVVLHDGYFTASSTLDELDLELTEEDWNQLRVITYYGYQYKGREGVRWYAATQFLVWEYLLQDTGEIYFIDEEGEKVDPLKEEIEAIRKDVSRYGVYPSFFEDSNPIYLEGEINQEIVLEDTNHVLDLYEYTSERYASVEEGKFIISIPYPGEYSFTFLSIYDRPFVESEIYYSASSQTVMSRGTFSPMRAKIYVTIDFPEFHFVKESEENSLPLKGATYELHYEDGSLYTTFTTDENGEFHMDEIYQGKYYLEEIEAPYGYQIHSERIYFEVTDQDVVLRVSDKPIKKKLTIEKYLENIDGKLELEDQAVFQVFWQDTGEFVTTFEMNEYGKYELVLSYGEYILRQIQSAEGYALHEDIPFTISDTTEDDVLVIKNPQIKGSLTVFKKDLDTQEFILEDAYFQIRNADTNQLVLIDDQDTFQTKDGILTINNLPYGNYELIEVQAPDGYQIVEEPYSFSIQKMDEEVQLEVYNEQKKKEVVIKKYLDYANGEKSLEEHAVFQVYHAKTDELIGTFQTDQEGEFSLLLPYGDYVLKQVVSTEGFLLADDLFFTVDEATSEKEVISVYNKQMVGSVLIQKKDRDTKELILKEAEFQVRNRDTGDFVTVQGESILKTKDGSLSLFSVPYGNYELIEVSAPYGYQKLEESIFFSVSSSEEIVLEVLNSCNQGSFLIQKLDYDHLEPLEGVLFGFYDKDKNLIGEYQTNSDGEIFLENLLSGIYYIKELNSVSGYELLDGFMEIEIKPNVLSTAKVTNRLKIEVPKTGVNDLIFTILFSACSLFVGVILCNYDKND